MNQKKRTNYAIYVSLFLIYRQVLDLSVTYYDNYDRYKYKRLNANNVKYSDPEADLGMFSMFG